MSAGALAEAARKGVGLFFLEDRGLLEVRGEDRVRWLNGMLSNDVACLRQEGAPRACYALRLTKQGRIVADLHVLATPECFRLETARCVIPQLQAELERFIIADDVVIEDRSETVSRFGLEGPRAPALLETAAGRSVELAPDDAVELRLGGVDCAVVAFGWSGEPAFQILAPRAGADAVLGAIRKAGAREGLVPGDAAALELLRIEAGIPRLGSELDESVLPAEARLERAISATKGCYTGQEVVARLRSQGQVSHLLVGLVFAEAPEVGAALRVTERKVGEVTSVAQSPRFGAIGLGFVRRPHDRPGTEVSSAVGPARVAALPFA